MMQRSDAGPASGGDGTQAHAQLGDERAKGGVVGLIIGSMGVVYGDIGTSPLYALRESLAHSVKADVLTEEAVIGPISLLIFALIFTVTIKYVVFLMRADNRGEGGILSLMALAQSALGGGSSAGLSARRRGCCVIFRRRHHHACDFGHVGNRGPGARHSPLQRIRSADHHFHPGHAVLGAEPWNGASRGIFRPDHDCVFPLHRSAGRRTHSRCAASVERLRPARWRKLSSPTWMVGVCGAGIGLPGRDRRRSALRRYGPFRPLSYSVCLARLRASGALAELSRPGSFDSFPSGGDRQSLLSFGAGVGPITARHFVDARHSHCESGGNYWRFFDRETGDSTGAGPSFRGHAYLRLAGGTNLYRPHQPIVACRRAAARHRLQKLVGSGVCIWHRRDGHYGGHDRARLRRGMEKMGLAVLGGVAC